MGRKVTYHNLDPDSRAGEVRAAIDLLVKARVCTQGRHTVTAPGCPSVPTSDDRTYKLLFMDVGLMNHVCGLDGPSIDAMDAVRLVNEGGIAEQYVGQQLATFGAGEARPGTPLLVAARKDGKRGSGLRDLAGRLDHPGRGEGGPQRFAEVAVAVRP